jgi:hypothetical protein
VGLLEASPADEAAGHRDEGVVEFGSAFPTDGKAFELVEQGEGLGDVVDVGRGGDDLERSAASVADQVVFAARPATVDR